MNINNSVENVGQIFPQDAAKPTSTRVGNLGGQTENSVAHGDAATLSTAATHLSGTSNETEVRQQRVASIQAALNAGTYQVSSAEVAKKVVDSLIAIEGLGASTKVAE